MPVPACVIVKKILIYNVVVAVAAEASVGTISNQNLLKPTKLGVVVVYRLPIKKGILFMEHWKE